MNILEHGLELFKGPSLNQLLPPKVKSGQKCSLSHFKVPMKRKLLPNEFNVRVRHKVYEETQKGLGSAQLYNHSQMLDLILGVRVSAMGNQRHFDLCDNVDEVFLKEMGFGQEAN